MAYQPTYASLLAEVQSYTEDSSPDFVAQYDSLLGRAMDTVQRTIDLEEWRETVTDHVNFNAREMPRPDCIRVRSLFMPDISDYLEARSYDFCRMYSGRGLPRYWAEKSTTVIYITPTPDNNYTVEMDLLRRLPTLTNATPTNWVTLNLGDLLLAALLMESAQFLKSPERMGEFQQTFQQKAELANKHFSSRARADYMRLPQVGGGA